MAEKRETSRDVCEERGCLSWQDTVDEVIKELTAPNTGAVGQLHEKINRIGVALDEKISNKPSWSVFIAAQAALLTVLAVSFIYTKETNEAVRDDLIYRIDSDRSLQTSRFDELKADLKELKEMRADVSMIKEYFYTSREMQYQQRNEEYQRRRGGQ